MTIKLVAWQHRQVLQVSEPPLAPGLLPHAKPASSSVSFLALSIGAELHVRFAFDQSLKIARDGQLDLWAVGFAFPRYCSWALFPSCPCQRCAGCVFTALPGLITPAHLLSHAAPLLLLIKHSSANLSVCGASSMDPLWVRCGLSFLPCLPLSQKIPLFLTYLNFSSLLPHPCNETLGLT